MQSHNNFTDNLLLREENCRLLEQLAGICSQLEASEAKVENLQAALPRLGEVNSKLHLENVRLKDENAQLKQEREAHSELQAENAQLKKERDDLATKWKRVNDATAEALKEEVDRSVKEQLALEKTILQKEMDKNLKAASDKHAADVRNLIRTIGKGDRLFQDIENTTKLVETKNAEIARLQCELSLSRMEVNSVRQCAGKDTATLTQNVLDLQSENWRCKEKIKDLQSHLQQAIRDRENSKQANAAQRRLAKLMEDDLQDCLQGFTDRFRQILTAPPQADQSEETSPMYSVD